MDGFDSERVLVVIDMQNDFITGALPSEDAKKIVKPVAERIMLAHERGEQVIFTRDMHFDNYEHTNEGRHIPKRHCVYQTDGFELHPIVEEARGMHDIMINKPAFGSIALAETLAGAELSADAAIELIGICTDICVISNALLLRSYLPEQRIQVNSRLCAGTSVANHENALNIMRGCCIDII